ncbi:MAG: TonB-system energizer ExbB [Thiovulaceae bacterium]|nr:TonB-system energizer ExbB [Sulfurimonadaceae bacterium]
MEVLENIVDYGILSLLALMGFVALWLFIERLLYFKKVDISVFTSKESLELDLTKHLSTIATIGSNAPYIGLLGTVFGIMLTFYQLGSDGQVETKEIMIGLALALKATAMGLVIAIPSIVFYNTLLRKCEVQLTRFQEKAS